MPKIGMRKINSLRESARFEAMDEAGLLHTVVERVAIETQVTFSIRYASVDTGLKSYYSSTSGDTLVRLSETMFEGKGGQLRLRLTAPEFMVGDMSK